jgi:hypothetical protein
MEGGEFVEDVMASLEAGMAKHLAAGHDVEGDAAEAIGDAAADVAWILAGGLPVGYQEISLRTGGYDVEKC